MTVAAELRPFLKSMLGLQNKETATRILRSFNQFKMCSYTYQINVQRLNVTWWNWWKWARRPWAPANEILMQLYLELYFTGLRSRLRFQLQRRAFTTAGGGKPSCTTPQNRRFLTILCLGFSPPFFHHSEGFQVISSNLTHFIFSSFSQFALLIHEVRYAAGLCVALSIRLD